MKSFNRLLFRNGEESKRHNKTYICYSWLYQPDFLNIPGNLIQYLLRDFLRQTNSHNLTVPIIDNNNKSILPNV